MLIRTINKQINMIFCRKHFRFISSSSWIKPDSGYDTGIKIYNCIAKKKVPLILKNENHATWYTCGPTVYDSTHIGHASCYVKLDIIQKILRKYFNIELITAMNITDIDDKIIRKSIELNIQNIQNISKLYENEFWKDLKNLNVQQPDIKIRVTENISIIIKFIEKLLKTEQAYIANDNSVYFHVNKYKNYGKLQKLNLSESKTLDINKEMDIDFVLWKTQKNLNEPAWNVPWSTVKGRPGWHVECSALATKIFGNNIDIHAGGLDLKFPHHENEEAQSCCFHNTKQWVNYWLHTGQLNLRGQDEKMSKSLKNTISVSELLEKYSCDEFRMACTLSNYRNTMEFSDELMILSKTTLNRFIFFISDCQAYLDGKKEIGSTESGADILNKLNKIKQSVDVSIRDDFDTSKCIGYLSDLTKIISKVINSNEEIYTASILTEVAIAKNYVEKILNTMGFMEKTGIANDQCILDDMQLHTLIDEVVEIRHNIRKLAIAEKNESLFKICDEIRKSFKSKNIEVKDHAKGSSWSSN